MKWIMQILLIMAVTKGMAQNSHRAQPWQVDLSAGLHSIYAPVKNLKWERPDWVYQAGIHKLMGVKQQFSLGLQLGFSGNRYQGNAVYVQLVGQYTPVIAGKIELGIGSGIGYRFSGYSSKPLMWNGSEWIKGKIAKGMLQVPLQFSIGYRSVKLHSTEFRPYVAWQIQSLFGYSPDLSFLPVSNFNVGIKINNYEK